jgi:hypothetical protein
LGVSVSEILLPSPCQPVECVKLSLQLPADQHYSNLYADIRVFSCRLNPMQPNPASFKAAWDQC